MLTIGGDTVNILEWAKSVARHIKEQQRIERERKLLARLSKGPEKMDRLPVRFKSCPARWE